MEVRLGTKSSRKSPRRFAVCPLTKLGTRAGRGQEIVEPGNRVADEINQRIWVEIRVKIRDEIQTKTGSKIASEKTPKNTRENTPETKAYTTQNERSSDIGAWCRRTIMFRRYARSYLTLRRVTPTPKDPPNRMPSGALSGRRLVRVAWLPGDDGYRTPTPR